MMKDKRVLILAPHTDDAELGAGGTLARWIEEGATLYPVAFSIAEISIPAGFAEDELLKEYRTSMASLGIPESQVLHFQYPTRIFHQHRQSILEEMLRLRKEIAPQIVLLPSGIDVHQDHQVIHQEGRRAFKTVETLMGFELPWGQYDSSNNCFVRLEMRHLETKWKCLNFYKTQTRRPYFNRELIFGIARLRGAQTQHEYAEAFELIRAIW